MGSKIYELIASGDLETLKVGKRRLVPADALRSCLSKFRVRA
jgi:excisionase family DNA binding protein